MQAQLMLTCLCDAFFGEVGIATVKVLEHAGCRVVFPEGQTCCGQPPYNSGDWDAAKEVARRAAQVFRPDLPVVTPSASCAAMVRKGWAALGVDAPRCLELSEYLLHHLSVERWPQKGSRVAPRRRVAFHVACHGRELGLGDGPQRLVSMIPGVEWAQFSESETCCGFGGVFSAEHPATSQGMGLQKLESLNAAKPDLVVTTDMGCALHLMTLQAQDGPSLRFLHYAQLLAEVIDR